jgi:hypothetical protein
MVRNMAYKAVSLQRPATNAGHRPTDYRTRHAA